MTVAELIEELQKHSPDAIVCVNYHEVMMNVESIRTLTFIDQVMDEFEVALIEYEHVTE